MASYFTKILESFPKVDISNFFVIDKKIYFHRQDLAKLFGVGTQSIKNYEAKGLERWEKSPNRVPMYEVFSALEWQDKNVNKKFRPNKQSTQKDKYIDSNCEQYEDEGIEDFLESLPRYQKEMFNKSELDYLDRLAKLKDIQKKETANRKELGELIDINDVDRAMSALAGVMMGSYIHYEDESSAELLHCKSATEIADKMREAHFEVFGELHEIINKEFGTGQGFYKIMSLVYQQLSKGTTVEQIENRLGNGK